MKNIGQICENVYHLKVIFSNSYDLKNQLETFVNEICCNLTTGWIIYKFW